MTSGRSVVGLVRTEPDGRELKARIREAMDLIGFRPEGSVNAVVIKPNLCYYWNSATGYTTDPKVVEAIIDYVREEFSEDVSIKVAEADASAMRTKYAFPLLGYRKLAHKKKITLVNLSEDQIVEKEAEANGRRISFQVPKILLESDLFINVPKLKVMRATHITCAMKNLFGSIAYPKKSSYHQFLNEAIVGINKILKPTVNVVDGLVALGRIPVRLGLLMASEDAFGVDCVAAQVMGYQPRKVGFLNLAAREGLGDPRNITVLGEKVEAFSKDFPRENNTFFQLKWNIQFSLLKAYKKLSGDVVPPVLEDI